MKVIAIANQKGGAGKTSTASALWYWLNHNGHDALAIDHDAQCNLSSAAAAKTNGGTALGILTQELAAPDVIQHTEQGDIIAASAKLSAADTMLADETGKEFRIKEALEPLADAYDFAIIDTPPHIGVLTKNALTAADYVVIPSQGDAFSLSGIEQIGKSIDAIRHYYNPALKVEGILLTRFNPRTTISQVIRDSIEETAQCMGARLFETTIREATAVKEAQLIHLSIFQHAPSSNVAEDYENFCKELIGGISL